jgi:hypothetical protein
VRNLGGVYLLAWSKCPPKDISPASAAVKYVGETAYFKNRMGAFGTSAGLWGERDNGHSGGWRWPKGAQENLWVAFFPVGRDLNEHLASGMRKWMEAVALEEHRREHDTLPQINASKSEVIFDE